MKLAHGPSAPVREHVRVARAGGTLFVRQWQVSGGRPQARLVVVHGYQEHGGRYRELACQLAAKKIEAVAADLRGHGRSTGPRGHVEAFGDYLHDLSDVLAAFAADALPTFVLGHSLGGLIVLRAAQDGLLNETRGLLVTNPYLALQMKVPAYKLALGRMLGHVLPNFGLGNGIAVTDLTHDPEVQAAYGRDPMLLNRATAGWLAATQAAQAQLEALQTLPVPLYFAYSDTDPIASPKRNAAFAEALRAQDKTVALHRGELHELLQEKNRLATMDAMAQWMLQRC